MKPIISVPEAELHNKKNISAELQHLGTQKLHKGVIELKPKSKKTTEVIRILREAGIMYQITFDAAAN